MPCRPAPMTAKWPSIRTPHACCCPKLRRRAIIEGKRSPPGRSHGSGIIRAHRLASNVHRTGRARAGCRVARDRRPADDLSIEELEALLARKRLERRQARLENFRRRAAPSPSAPIHACLDPDRSDALPSPGGRGERRGRLARPGGEAGRRSTRCCCWSRSAAVLGLAFVLLSGVGVLRTLNREVAQALAGPTPTATPLITAVVLPSGHTPPNSPAGAAPNEAEIPANLRPLVQSLAQVPMPDAGPRAGARHLHPGAVERSGAGRAG